VLYGHNRTIEDLFTMKIRSEFVVAYLAYWSIFFFSYSIQFVSQRIDQ